MKRIIFPLIIMIMFISCASLPVVNSSFKENESVKSTYRFDVENNIAYKVEHDDSYLYLELKIF